MLALIVGWSMRALLALGTWAWADEAFGKARNPWRSALAGVLWALGIATFLAVISGVPSCGDNGLCDDSLPPNLHAQLSYFLMLVTLMGLGMYAAYVRHHQRFAETE